MRAGSSSGSAFLPRWRSRGSSKGGSGEGTAVAMATPARSHYNAGRVHLRVRLAQRGDDAFAPSVARAQIDEQHLVLAVMDDLAQLLPAPHQVGRRHLALEDRKLQM